MFPLALQALALILLAWPFGLALHPIQMLFGLTLLALFGAGVAALSYALAIAARRSGRRLFYMVSQSVALPLMLLGGVLLPIENGPGWLYIASRFNPLTYLVEAERALFAGELFTSTVLWGVLVALGTAVVGLSIGARADPQGEPLTSPDACGRPAPLSTTEAIVMNQEITIPVLTTAIPSGDDAARLDIAGRTGNRHGSAAGRDGPLSPLPGAAALRRRAPPGASGVRGARRLP